MPLRLRGLGNIPWFPQWNQSRTSLPSGLYEIHMQMCFGAESWNFGELRANCRRVGREVDLL